MTSYTVEWNPVAERELAKIWNTAVDRAAVTRAQALADRLLAQNPHGNGWHVSEGLHQINCPPLAISFIIDEAQKLVTVTSVRKIIS